jgi:hypothetical protein
MAILNILGRNIAARFCNNRIWHGESPSSLKKFGEKPAPNRRSATEEGLARPFSGRPIVGRCGPRGLLNYKIVFTGIRVVFFYHTP